MNIPNGAHPSSDEPMDLAEVLARAAAGPLDRTGLNTPEPEPTPNDSTPIWELVIADMRERDQAGRAKYGVPLQAGNGRNSMVDAYQEALDLAVYLRQEIEERSKNVVK